MRPIQEYIIMEDLRDLKTLKASVAEFIGTFVLVLIGCGSVITLNPDDGPRTISVAWAFGLGLAMVIWIFGHVSGAHVNPSVTVGFVITRHMGAAKGLCYIVAQCLGAITAAGYLRLVLPEAWLGNMGSTVLANGCTVWQGFVIEVVNTFLLVLCIFASCDRLRTDHGGSIGLAIGFCLTAQIGWTGSVTGASMNPARSLGPAVVTSTWTDHWIYWAAPMLGAVASSLMYEYFFAESTPEMSQGLQKYSQQMFRGNKVRKEGFLEYTIDINPPEGDGEEAPPVYDHKPVMLDIVGMKVVNLNEFKNEKTYYANGNGVTHLQGDDDSDASSSCSLYDNKMENKKCLDLGQLECDPSTITRL